MAGGSVVFAVPSWGGGQASRLCCVVFSSLTIVGLFFLQSLIPSFLKQGWAVSPLLSSLRSSLNPLCTHFHLREVLLANGILLSWIGSQPAKIGVPLVCSCLLWLHFFNTYRVSWALDWTLGHFEDDFFYFLSSGGKWPILSSQWEKSHFNLLSLLDGAANCWRERGRKNASAQRHVRLLLVLGTLFMNL